MPHATHVAKRMLDLKGVFKSYDGREILHGIDLKIPAGRTSVLIGPSGSGKSTLLRLMLGLIRPDRGSVQIDQVEITRANVLAVRRRLGYVVQEGGLFPHRTARQNVTLLARYLGWERALLGARLEELTELTRFPPEALDRYPAQLSGGQRQRVSLMRALMLDPLVLLLDEPLAALDPMIRSDLQQDLRRIFRSLGKTVVLVTHDLAEAAYFGDRIVLLREGKVVQQGTLQELIRSPADPFVKHFVKAQRGLLETLEHGEEESIVPPRAQS
jgi:osmoprotectant transport system ATP-binding protein